MIDERETWRVDLSRVDEFNNQTSNNGEKSKAGDDSPKVKQETMSWMEIPYYIKPRPCWITTEDDLLNIIRNQNNT